MKLLLDLGVAGAFLEHLLEGLEEYQGLLRPTSRREAGGDVADVAVVVGIAPEVLAGHRGRVLPPLALR